MSRLKQYIKEEFFLGFKYGGEYIEVFVNPSKKELKRIPEIRFIADNKKKKVYAWDSEFAIHTDVWDKIGDSRDIYDSDTLLSGLAKKVGGKWKMTESDTYEFGGNLINGGDFKWCDKYIEVSKKLKEWAK